MIVSAARKSDRSRIGALLPDVFCVDTNVSDISNIPHGIGGRSGLPVPTYPFRCTSPRSSQFLSWELRFF